MTTVPRLYPWIGSVFAVVMLATAGCSGIATSREKQARRQIEAVEAQYPPSQQKKLDESRFFAAETGMELPVLTDTSTLSDLLSYAFWNNPKIRAAFYDWKAAVEAITIARSLPDPMLTMSVEIMRDVTALTPGVMTDPGASWPWPGKLKIKADAAYHDAMKKRAMFENELLAATLGVKQAYYQLWVTDEQIRRTREALALLAEIEQLAGEQLRVAQASLQDVLRIEIEKDLLTAQLADFEDSRAPIVSRLKAAMGVRHDENFPNLTANLESGDEKISEEIILKTAFARNPQLQAMRSEVRQAIALYHLDQQNTIPEFSFGLEANVKSSPVTLMPSAGVSVPIWRDRIAAEIARGRATAQAAGATLSAEELALAVRCAEAVYSSRQADRNVTLYQKNLLPKAAALLEAVKADYMAGATRFTNLLDAERMVLEYHINHAEAAGRRETALAEISLVILGRLPENMRKLFPDDDDSDSSSAENGGQNR